MVTENPDGSLSFRTYCPHGDCVEIRGSLTPPGEPGIMMDRDGEGWWRARLRLAPGDYTFRYIVNGQGSIPDYAAGGLMRDERGAWVSCLHVPERAAADGAEAPEVRTATVSEAELALLLAGRRVELRLDGSDPSPLVISVALSRVRTGRAAPRPDQPAERPREGVAGRTGRRGHRTHAG